MSSENYPVFKFTSNYVELKENFEHLGIVVPKGFKSYNGNSVPSGLRLFLGHPFKLKTIRASLIHDYLYYSKAGRKFADNKYYEALTYDRVNCAWLYYVGVRIFGGLRYK